MLTHILIALFAVFVLLALAGVVYQALGAARDARELPPPGEMVDVGGRRLHLHAMGQGSPTVVLEAGVAASSLSWSGIQPEVARFARVLSYDRAGLGWSEPSPQPVSARQKVEELRTLLDRAAIGGPYLLVGHSFGGLLAQMYATLHPGEVAGLVLLDALHAREWLHPTPEQRRMIRGSVFFSRVGAVLASVGFVRFCLSRFTAGSTGMPRAVLSWFGRGATAVVSRLVGEIQKLPTAVWPMVRAHWCLPKCYWAMAQHLAALPRCCAEAAAAAPLPDIPLIVVSAGDATPARMTEQQALVRSSTQACHLIATASGHWVQLDQPELVVHAIHELVELWRKKDSSSQLQSGEGV